MFLMQYFCLHGILPFSKSYPETESTWPTTECTHLHSYLCNALCKFFSKLEAINVFPKHILKSKARDQSIQAKKKLFWHRIVHCLCNVSRMFFIKIERMWRWEIKEQAPSWLYSTLVGLSEAATRGVV